ncbi:MAG: SEC-C domain-containing protein [Gammaproteobacteria bacterium]|nr:SEC-C domain-containing protein [Gammaproteobacteria bacterium]
MSNTPPATQCPCGSQIAFKKCCAPFLSGERSAETALALMRSRYCAYVSNQLDYVLQTWHPSTRPAMTELEPRQWLGLRIRKVSLGGPNDCQGVVEFIARYRVAGKGYRLHETSRFETQDGRWLYVDGDIHR